MNGTLKVTPEKLKAGASEFKNAGSVVKGLTNQMTSMIDGLSSVWSGEAAQAYKQRFHKLDDDISRMNKMIQEHVDDLNTMANVYKQAEDTAKNKASALPVNPVN